MFQLPQIPTAKGLIDKAFGSGAKEAKKKKAVSLNIPKEIQVKRSEDERVKTIAGIILADLRNIIKNFPVYEDLPLFYQDLLDVKIDKGKYKKSLGAVGWCLTRIQNLRNKTVTRIKYAGREDKNKISVDVNEFMGRTASYVNQISENLDNLIEIRETLLNFPEIEKQPTIVVAGFPNVGKSTFLRTLTGSKVKIAPYPFTTKEIYVGHIKSKFLVYRLIDTPGLLDRPIEDRNLIEIQAVLAMKHLADVLFFIVDPTEPILEFGGFNRQLSLLYELRKNFPNTPMLIAINKIDLVTDQNNLKEIENKLSEFTAANNVVKLCANDHDSALNAFNEARKLFKNLSKYK